jgi:cyclophilin family peptidyl-prolyl cis-trans isomerase
MAVRPLAFLLLLAALLIAAAGCGGGGSDNSGDSGSSGDSYCEVTSTEGGDVPDLTPLDTSETHELVMETNKGSFTVKLDPEQSPCATASLVQLAKKGFFDGTKFHRIVPGFVIQGGDPTGSGSGGPGYSTVDTPPSDASYTKGVVAMAKTAAEAPGTSGSQFFVVTGADVGLDPDYAIVGEVSDGLDVVEKIGKLGNAQQQPTENVVLEKVTAKP